MTADADPRLVRSAINRAMGRLDEADWLVIADQAACLVEEVNRRNPKARFNILDAVELLAKIGMLLIGERAR